jgi:prepilin-type N-terminal cleavage/methylation domain-containing protein
MESRSDGFTLLEILVAVCIMAMVLTFAFEAYQGIEHSYQRVGHSPSRDRAARIVLDRLERELVGSILIQREDVSDPNNPLSQPLSQRQQPSQGRQPSQSQQASQAQQPYFFWGEPKAYSEAEADTLRFVTRTPIRPPGAPDNSFEIVTYGAVPSQSGSGFSLLRQAEPLSQQLVKEVTWESPDMVADNVATFLVRYHSDQAQATEGWDSTAAEQLDQLPASVVVTVSLWEHDESGKDTEGPEFTRTIDLPVRPFKLTPENAANKGDCGEGMTVVECVQQFSEQIGEASPSLATAIKDAQGQVQDTCWNPPQPSAALQRLKVLMGGVPGFDAGECK